MASRSIAMVEKHPDDDENKNASRHYSTVAFNGHLDEWYWYGY